MSDALRHQSTVLLLLLLLASTCCPQADGFVFGFPTRSATLAAVTLMRVHLHSHMHSAALFFGQACLFVLGLHASMQNQRLASVSLEPILGGSLGQLVCCCCPVLQLPCAATALPCRFGMMCAQMKAFFDATGSHWSKGALVGLLAEVCSPQTDTSSTFG